jgi:predicted dehydrogenase
LGLGYGAAVHVPAFQAIPGVEIVALGSRDKRKADAQAARLGVKRGATVDEVLNLPLDAVSIALPPAVSGEVAARAIARGLAVLCEKPIAATAQQASDLARQAIRAVTAVGFQFAELDSFKALKQVIEPIRSELLQVHISWRTLSYAQRMRSWSWKTDRDSHGGVLNLYGMHVLYLIEWLFGEVRSVAAVLSDAATRQLAPPNTVSAEDTVWLRLITRDVVVEVDLCSADNQRQCHEWKIDAKSGTYVLGASSRNPLGPLCLTRHPENVIVAEDPPSGSQDVRLWPFGRLASRFIDAIRGHGTLRPDFGDAARVQYLAECALKSAADAGRPIATTS